MLKVPEMNSPDQGDSEFFSDFKTFLHQALDAVFQANGSTVSSVTVHDPNQQIRIKIYYVLRPRGRIWSEIWCKSFCTANNVYNLVKY